jgi:hypothetical protein
MPLAIELSRTTFAAGEVSPELRARADLAKAQTGLWFLENMIVLLEGGVTRRPGTAMVLQLDAAHAYVEIPFRFSGSGSNAYCIVIGNGVAQFLLNNSVVAIGGGNNNPYTVAVPYTDADLGGAGAATPGVSNLRWAMSGNVVYLFCDGYAPQTLTRNADNSWTLANAVTPPINPIPQGGCIAPVNPENLDPAETIAVTPINNSDPQTVGQSVTLSATAAFAGANATVPGGFQNAHVGTVWRLDESNLSIIPEWTADEDISPPSVSVNGNATAYFGTFNNNGDAFTSTSPGATYEGVAAYCGAELNAASALSSATVYSGAAGRFLSQETGTPPVGASVTFTLLGANVEPDGPNAGTQLGQVTIGDGETGAGTVLIPVTSTEAFSFYWILVNQPFSSDTITLGAIVLQSSTGASPLYRRYNGNVYQGLNPGTAGANPPVHTSGTVLSGEGGINWLYVHRGYGFVQIAGVQNATTATATVLEAIPLSTCQQATPSWWPSAWDGINGWPDRAKIIRNSLVTGRQDYFWITQPGTFNNYDAGIDPTSSQAALSGRLISPSGSLAWIESFMGGLYLGALTRDEEWVLVGQDILSAISIENLSPYVSKQEGNAVHVPAEGEGGLITIDRTRSRAIFMELAYSYFMPQFGVEELTLASRHILGLFGGGALGVSWQQSPNRIAWFWTANGLLVGNTLMRDQQINGWHRHPQHAATKSQVQGIATIPSNDEGMSWTYLQTQRTIAGQPQKFIELMQPYFQPADPFKPTAAGAFFVDCGTSYSFPNGATEISGLQYLAGCEVAINADGCEYRNANGSRVVVPANGTITLSRTTFSGCVGLPIKYRARSLPFDLEISGKSTVGEKQKANHVALQLVNSAGGAIRVNPHEPGAPIAPEPLTPMRALTGAFTYGDPVPLFTGVLRPPAIEAPLADQTVIEIEGDDTMPFTLSGWAPDVIEQETD